MDHSRSDHSITNHTFKIINNNRPKCLRPNWLRTPIARNLDSGCRPTTNRSRALCVLWTPDACRCWFGFSSERYPTQYVCMSGETIWAYSYKWELRGSPILFPSANRKIFQRTRTYTWVNTNPISHSLFKKSKKKFPSPSLILLFFPVKARVAKFDGEL